MLVRQKRAHHFCHAVVNLAQRNTLQLVREAQEKLVIPADVRPLNLSMHVGEHRQHLLQPRLGDQIVQIPADGDTPFPFGIFYSTNPRDPNA